MWSLCEKAQIMRGNTRFAQDNDYKTMLHTSRWQKLRCLKLSRNPYCEACAEERRYRVATEVHHRVPVMSVPDAASRIGLMYDIGNLVSLCHECHVSVHRMMGKQTKAENRRRTEDRLSVFSQKYGL